MMYLCDTVFKGRTKIPNVLSNRCGRSQNILYGRKVINTPGAVGGQTELNDMPHNKVYFSCRIPKR